MNDRKPALLTVILVALFGLSSALRRSEPAPPESPLKKTAEKGASDGAIGRALRSPSTLKPLHDFLVTSRDDQDATELLPGIDGYDVRCMIAIVPDPTDSRFGYRFDFVYDSIQLAIEEAGYIPDRWELPWSDTPLPPERGAAPKSEAKDLKEPADGTSISYRPQERRPGVVIFREAPSSDDAQKPANPAKPRLLVLFLVGETSTWGIQKVAFEESLELLLKLDPEAGTTGDKSVLIDGPGFSGSVESVRMALKAWGRKRRPVHLKIYSGSTTAISPDAFKDCGPPGGVTFRTTVHNEKALVDAVKDYLKKTTSTSPDKIALLVETDTGFGSHASEVVNNKTDRGGLVLPFPLHISDVRSAYGRGDSATAAKSPSLDTPIDRIPIPFEEDRQARDVVPSLAAKMTASTENLLLSKILMTIARERIRHVGIIASDTRDKLFLIDLINKYCPDVQIFFTNSDLLLTFPAYSHDLEGSIVVSTYPLYSPSQNLCYPFDGLRRRVMFANESDQGYYNATLALLGRGDLLDYGPPDPFMTAEKFRKGTAPTAPPVWISVIGEHGPWPLRIHEAKEDPRDPILHLPLSQADRDKAAKNFNDGKRARVPYFMLPWVSICCGASLAASFLALAYLDGAGAPPPFGVRWTGVESSLADLFRRLQDRGRRRKQRLRTVACLAIALLFYGLAAQPAFLPMAYEARTGTASFSEYGVVALGTAAVVLALLQVSGRARRDMRIAWGVWLALTVTLVFATGIDRHESFLVPLMPFVVLGVVSLLGVALTAELWSARPTWTPSSRWVARAGAAWFASLTALAVVRYGWWGDLLVDSFAFSRTVNLGSGVTPTFSALLIGGALVGWQLCQLKRYSLLDSFRVPSPYPLTVKEKSSFPNIVDLDRELMEALEQPWSRVIQGPASLSGLLALSLLLALVFTRIMPTAEGTVFNVLTGLGFGVGAALCLFTFAHAYRVWKRFKQLLRQLSLIPMSGAYHRLPAKVAILFGGYLSAFVPRLSHLALAVQQRDSLAQAYTHSLEEALRDELRVDPEVVAGLNRLRGPTMTEGFERQLSEAPAVKIEGEIFTTLQETARDCLAALHEYWPRLTAAEAYKSASAAVSPSVVAAEDGAEAKKDQDGEPMPSGENPPLSDPLVDWLERAEDLVAIVTITYASQFSLHLRNLLAFLTFGPLTLLAAVALYPFQPHMLLTIFFWVLSLIVIASAVWAFVRIDRDEFMSNVLKTTPNRLNLDHTFIMAALTVTVPLLGILVAQFPTVSDFLASHLGPLFRIMK